MAPLLLLSTLVSPSFAETHAPGTVLSNAAVLDIPPEGFEAIASSLAAVIPSEIEVPDSSDEGGTWCFNYVYELSNMWVAVELADTTITPMDGYLDVTMTLNVQVNDASDPFNLYLEVACIGDTCEGHVEPFPVTIHTTLSLDVVTGSDGAPALDATVGALEVSYDLDTEDDVDLGSCGIETLRDVLGFFGLDLYGWFLDLIGPTLETAISDLGPTLETTIEDAFTSANIEQDIDLNGIALHVQLYPEDVLIDPGGVRVAMAGALSTDSSAECIAPYDPGGSLATPSDPPAIGEVPAGADDGYHVAAIVSDDFANQGLYALWRGGLLCYSLGADAGLPLDTGTVLGVLAGDAFDDFFPEAQPITIQTRPKAAPTLGLSGDHDLNVDVTQLGLEIYTEIDGRQAQVVGLELGVQAGADLNLDSATGALAIALDLGTDSLDCAVGLNEFAPDATAEIESQCGSALGSLASTVLGGLLPDLSFTLPAFGTLGVTDLQATTTGASADWLGMYAWVGEVSYGSSDGSLGCGGGTDTGSGSSSGCSGGGCSSGGASVSRWGVLLLPLALAALRRRR